MGLDLYHYKATLTPNNDTKIRADEFDAEAIERLGFGRFMQIIPDTDWPCRILIAADQTSLDYALRPEIGYTKDRLLGWFVGHPLDFTDQITTIERQHGLDTSRTMGGLDYTWQSDRGRQTCCSLGLIDKSSFSATFDWSDSQRCQEEFRRTPPQPGSEILKYFTISYPIAADYLGLYVEQVGYQRNGMKDGFLKKFSSQPVYWLKTDVEQAMTYLDHDAYSELEY